MARRPGPAKRPTQLATPHHKNAPSQQSSAQLAKQGRPKAIDFLSEWGDTTTRLRKARDDESGDDDSNVDSDRDEEDIDAPRVAQWIDVEDLELEEQTDDTSDSERASGNDSDHSASGAGPSRTLVSTSCVIWFHSSAESYTFH